MEETMTKVKGGHKYTIKTRIEMNVGHQGHSSGDDSSKYQVSLAGREWLVNIVDSASVRVLEFLCRQSETLCSMMPFSFILGC